MARSVPFERAGAEQEVVKATSGSVNVPIGVRSSGLDGDRESLYADGMMRFMRSTGVDGLPSGMFGGDDVENGSVVGPPGGDRGCDTSSTETGRDSRMEVIGVLAKIESVARSACDVEVVKALAGNTTGLRTYFEKAENVALNSLSVMAATVGAYPDFASACEGIPPVRVDTRGLTPGYEKPSTEVYPDGYCYLDWTHDYTLRLVMAELGKWPTLGALVRQRLEWFDLKAIACSSLYSTGGGKRLHVTVEGGGRVSSLSYLVNWVRQHGSGTGVVVGWPKGSLGEYLASMDAVRPLASASGLALGAVIGGEDSGVPGGVRDAVLDDLVERCKLPQVDRSRLWEALQLVGNGVTEVDGRPMMSGNKVLAMLGDSVLKAALIGSATHFRVGDIQAAISDLLSNGCLSDLAKMYMVAPLLQGSLGGARPSDYVLATAVEAIAAACYYGGGMDSVHSFLCRAAAMTGRSVRYPWLRGANEGQA